MDPIIAYQPGQIMARPDQLRQLTQTYFALLEGPATPAALALHLGFASVPKMIHAAGDPEHPQESSLTLQAALTRLEHEMTTNALLETAHPAFTKYIMQARLNVIEPKQSIDDKPPIQINILGVGNQQIALTDLL